MAHGPLRQIRAAHGHHRLEAVQGVSRSVGVNGGHGALVTGVHGLEHVKGFFTANLTDDDTVRPHTNN